MKIIHRFISLTVFCCLLSNFSQAQDSTTLFTLGNTLLLKGYTFLNSNNIDSALWSIDRASENYKKAGNWKYYVSALNDIAIINYSYNRYSTFDASAQAAYRESKKYLTPSDSVSIKSVNNISLFYYKMGDFEKSIDVLKQNLDSQIKKKYSGAEIATTYFNLANSYKFLGDNDNAFLFYKKALDIRLKASKPKTSAIARTYQSLGKVFQNTNELDSAIYYFEKTADLLAPIQSGKTSMDKKINNFLVLAQLWAENQNSQKSSYYIDQALSLPLNNNHQVYLQKTLGNIALIQENYDDAIAAFKKSQNIAETNNQRNTPPLKVRRLIQLASAYSATKSYNNALTTYQEGLQTLSPKFTSDDYRENPKANQLLDKPDALILLNEKANVLFQLYNINQNNDYLKAAYDTYLTATNLIGDIRQGVITIDAKKSLSEKAVPIYEGAIKTALSLAASTKDTQYKTMAFHLAESNKALLLLESINEQSAKGFAGIPDSLLAKEKDLKLQFAFLQKTLLNGKAVPNIEERIFDVQQKIDQLTSGFEKDYPRYFELKYQNDPVDLNIIQQTLKENNTALLEYFFGEETLYLFVVTSNGLDIKTISNSEAVLEAIQKLRLMLNKPPGADAQAEFAQFSSTAHTLYTLLIEPTQTIIPASIAKLTIIPDDQLNYIPFSILLTEVARQNQPGYGMANLDYLMEKYVVNYHYSATLLHKSQQRKKKTWEHDFIGFAPSFRTSKSIASRACTSDELYSLQCSSEEVNQISTLLGGISKTDAQASKSAFEQEAANYRIIHLATHACVDENNADFNKIFLTDDFLSNDDLYNLELNAELAVLSACNTGSGELVKGEGVMNLARGFINAGCSSTLMSMWSVDDCATSDIMIRFYESLKKGVDKDEALNAAKLTYLESVSKTKMHPYYWAAFVPFGDMKAMEVGKKAKWLFYVIPIALFLLLFVFVNHKKANRS